MNVRVNYEKPIEVVKAKVDYVPRIPFIRDTDAVRIDHAAKSVVVEREASEIFREFVSAIKPDRSPRESYLWDRIVKACRVEEVVAVVDRAETIASEVREHFEGLRSPFENFDQYQTSQLYRSGSSHYGSTGNRRLGHLPSLDAYDNGMIRE